MSVGPLHGAHQGSGRSHEQSRDWPARTSKTPSSGQRGDFAVAGRTDPQHHRPKPTDHLPPFGASADTSSPATRRAEAEAADAQSDDLAAYADLTASSPERAVPAGRLHLGGAPLLTADLYRSNAGITLTPESPAANAAARHAQAVAPLVRSTLDMTPFLSSSVAIAYPVAQPDLTKSSAPYSADVPGAPAAGERPSDSARTKQLLDLTMGAPARRYGSIPVIVSGQLIELQFVALQLRQGAAALPMLHRLNLTLKTPALGSVQVTAQTHGDRLSVTLSGAEGSTAEELAAHTGGVTELLSRLGWQADSVTFAVGDANTAARPNPDDIPGDSTMDHWL